MNETESEMLRRRVAKDCRILYGGEESAYWECQAGWDDPLEKLSYKLEALNVQYGAMWKVKVMVAQVKEKFGTLRFYYDCQIDTVDEPTVEQEVMRRYVEILADEYVREAEKACYGVCEFCGKEIGTEKSPRCCTLGWYRYVCRLCAEKGVDGSPFKFEMNGKYYKGKTRIENPFKKKGKSK